VAVQAGEFAPFRHVDEAFAPIPGSRTLMSTIFGFVSGTPRNASSLVA